MDTYVMLGCGFGLGLLIAMWGMWNLRQRSRPVSQESGTKDAAGYQPERE